VRAPPAYTEYHPRWFRRRISTYWWLGQWSYLLFILRELTSVFVAYWVLITLLQISALKAGPQAHAQFQEFLRAPLLVTLNAISLLFVVFHAVTWFNLLPQVLVLRVGGKRLPGAVIAAAHYFGWGVVSAAVAWLLVGA